MYKILKNAPVLDKFLESGYSNSQDNCISIIRLSATNYFWNTTCFLIKEKICHFFTLQNFTTFRPQEVDQRLKNLFLDCPTTQYQVEIFLHHPHRKVHSFSLRKCRKHQETLLNNDAKVWMFALCFPASLHKFEG